MPASTACCRHVDYLIASSRISRPLDRHRRSVSGPAKIQQNRFGMRVAAMTLGAHGALALENGRFVYSPAFVVNCVDTTGAGDVFHGAFCYSVLQQMPIAEALEFLQRHGSSELHRRRRPRRHRHAGRSPPSAGARGRAPHTLGHREHEPAKCFLCATTAPLTRRPSSPRC